MDGELQIVIRKHCRQDAASGCWQWISSTVRGGYGQLTFRQKHLTAHRASFLAFKGDIPDGKLICHTCDNRLCVNPDHLYAGTYVDNRRDMLERSGWAHPYGKRTACTKGHPYVDGSFSIAADGSRICRVCMRAHKKRYRERKIA